MRAWEEINPPSFSGKKVLQACAGRVWLSLSRISFPIRLGGRCRGVRSFIIHWLVLLQRITLQEAGSDWAELGRRLPIPPHDLFASVRRLGLQLVGREGRQKGSAFLMVPFSNFWFVFLPSSVLQLVFVFLLYFLLLLLLLFLGRSLLREQAPSKVPCQK